MAQNEIDRRNFLRAGLAASALVVAETSLRPHALALGAVRFPTPVAPFAVNAAHAAVLQQRSLPLVRVSRERLIRSVVGLRPFRSEGFVVAAEKLGAKLLVHNYGHGGAGITLSWGTASLAVDHARDFTQSAAKPPGGSRNLRRASSRNRHPGFAVLGCGVNGLSTARLLQQRFADGAGNVTIYAKSLPPDTTSNIAGGFWYPTSVYDAESVTPKFAEQFRLACQISQRAFQTLVGPEYGVRWTETYELLRHEESVQREVLGGAQLYPQTEIYRDAQSYFGFPYTRRFSTMLIEPHTYLRALLRDFYIAGGKVVVKEFQSREEIARLREAVIFNCTGLGSRALFNDEKLIPVRGQLEVLLPQPEIDYCYLAGGSYMFPRRDGIILGGTWGHEDWRLEPDPEITTRILAANAEIMKAAQR